MSKVKQSSWWPFDFSYNRSTVGEAGERDGEASPSIPQWEAHAQPPFVRELRRAGLHDMQTRAKEWVEKDEDLKASWREARKERNQAQERRQRAEKRVERARSRYREKHGSPAPEEPPSRWGYLAFIVSFFLMEIPINGYAFQIFGESLGVAAVAGILVGVILLASAHQLGTMLRNTESWSWTKVTLATLLSIVPILVVGAVSSVRSGYARYMQAQGDAAGVAHLGGNGATFWIFAAINVGLFVVATYAAYRAHPKWERDLRLAKSDLESARGQYEEADERCVETATVRTAAFEEKRTEVLRLRQTIRKLAQRYKDRNLHARDDRDSVPEGDGLDEGDAYPRSYAVDLTLEIPEPLQGLDWSLTDGPTPDSETDQESGDGDTSGPETRSEERSPSSTNGRAAKDETA